MARSLVIYHGIPGRQRRLRRLYRQFVQPGDLAFDVGAHAGNRTRALAALGCRVVAFEPQPAFAELLRRFWSSHERVEILEAAVGSTSGRAWLEVDTRNPTVTTLATEWREARSREAGFGHVAWDQRVEVDVTTLDEAIGRFGVPAFIKIDVEGLEPDVLAGLSQRVPALSFEYLPGALDEVRACSERLQQLGSYAFNWSPRETFALASEQWLDAGRLIDALRSPAAQRSSGDVYARLTGAL